MPYAIRCEGDNCQDSYIGETKQPLHKPLYQHRRAGSYGNDSAVFTHLKESGHKFEDKNISILDKEQKWFERGVREAVHVNTENPSLNRGGGLRHNLSLVYNPVIREFPRRLNNKDIVTASSPSRGEFQPDRAEEATRTSRELSSSKNTEGPVDQI